ncbi:MAG: transglutaminase-like domain-containing protein [Desulfobulbaceae bacterium]
MRGILSSPAEGRKLSTANRELKTVNSRRRWPVAAGNSFFPLSSGHVFQLDISRPMLTIEKDMNTEKTPWRMISRIPFRLLLTGAWIILLVLLFTRDYFIPGIGERETILLEKARQERFYGVWFERRRIGYVAEVLRPAGDGFLLEQEARILLNVLNTTQPVEMQVKARLSPALVLRDFDFRFRSPFYTMSANGRAEGNKVFFTLDTGQATINDSISLSGPPLLAANDRSFLLRELKEPGQKIRVPSFDPVSLSGRDSIITYHGREKLLVRRRLKVLHHFSEISGGMRINFWLNDEGRIVKEESPAGFKFIAEPEFRAKDIVDTGSELLRAVAVPLSGPLPPEDSDLVRYRLDYPPDLDLDLEGGRQTLEGNVLTIVRDREEPQLPANGTVSCSEERFLSPSRYVQSDSPEIADLSRSIIGDTKDPILQVRRLAGWVYDNLEKRPVLGLPDALTTLKNRKGDCNEHASLFAALARSVGIPTAIATGVTLQDGAFYYHAWNEVCLNGRWISLDTTTNQLPADLFHIRFGRGDLEEQLKVGALLGKLRIEILP